MKRTTYATHITLWALYAVTIFNGSACIRRNPPSRRTQNDYSHSKVTRITTKQDTINQKKKEDTKIKKPQPPSPYSTALSKPKEKNQIEAYIQRSHPRPSSLIRVDVLPTRYWYRNSLPTPEATRIHTQPASVPPAVLPTRDQNSLPTPEAIRINELLRMLLVASDEAFTSINAQNAQQAIPNAPELPTKQSLIESLREDNQFNTEEKNAIAYRLENLTVGGHTTYDRPDIEPIAISELCAACGSTDAKDIFTFINQQIKQEKQKKEDKKREIKSKIWDIMKQTEVKNAENAECSICLNQDDNEDKDNLYALRCGHYFHIDCITQWAFDHATCPNCRQSIFSAPNGEPMESN